MPSNTPPGQRLVDAACLHLPRLNSSNLSFFSTFFFNPAVMLCFSMPFLLSAAYFICLGRRKDNELLASSAKNLLPVAVVAAVHVLAVPGDGQRFPVHDFTTAELSTVIVLII